ncbi:MAG: hypothetical protein DA408_08745 [Bacteroidetes bacterium]|nr:MAG: hypothetical protein C7N36_00300 [Bacteroidota bacterium]PTM12932.1 MAG: hypothetical protein DA408_08745 [Bacteroidota bacterium]
MDIDSILDDSHASAGSKLVINNAISDFLSESARWARFIAIVGFVFVGLSLLGVLAGGSTLLAVGLPSDMDGFSGLFVVFFLAISAVALVPLYYLYNFATKMQVALAEENPVFLADAFENHKSFFKFYGIMLAIVLGFYALVFVFGLLFATF